MKILTTLTLIASLATTFAGAEPLQHGGGGAHPAPAPRPAAPAPRPAPVSNPVTNRPQAAPTQVVRPAENPPSGGDHRSDNQPPPHVNPAPQHVNPTPQHVDPAPQHVDPHPGAPNVGPRPQDGHPGVRPVFSDSRGNRPEDRAGIRVDPFTRHIGFDPHYAPRPYWNHFYPVHWWVSYPYPVGYGWANVSAVTCQAQFIANDPMNPNNNDVYTADSSIDTWGPINWAAANADGISNQTLGEALDECADDTAGQDGQCVPVENPDDVDGCFLTFY